MNPRTPWNTPINPQLLPASLKPFAELASLTMNPQTRAYLRALDKLVGNLSAHLTAAAEYHDRVEHYDKATAERYEEWVQYIPGILAELSVWAEENMPVTASTNGRKS